MTRPGFLSGKHLARHAAAKTKAKYLLSIQGGRSQHLELIKTED